MFTNGSKYLRADFHLHTKADKEFKYEGEETEFIKSYISKLKEQKISIGVITNHNKFDFGEYKGLKKRAKKENIFLLPGVEFSIKEGKNGLHTIIVFNPDEWIKNGKEHINIFLNTAFIGIDNRENANSQSNYDLLKTFEELNKFNKDYFIILAHVDQKSGFFKECNGSTISNLTSKKDFRKKVLGFQKVKSRDNLQKYKQNSDYIPAFLEGSDPKCINDIGKGEKTFVKIGNLDFLSVKYALIDHINRVFSQISENNKGFIESISVEGGALNNQTINFSNELNSIIGIRGSGKSTIIELLRYGLGFNAGEDDKGYKDKLINELLGSGGKIELKIRDNKGELYKVSRILNEDIVIRNEKDEALSISIHSIINKPIYFGQKDLSSKRDNSQLEILNKIQGSQQIKNSKLEEINDEIFKTLRNLIKLEKIPSELSNQQSLKADFIHKMTAYKEKGVDKKLQKQSIYQTDYLQTKDTLDDINNINLTLSESIDKIDKIKIQEKMNFKSKYNQDIFDKIDLELSKTKDSINIIDSELNKIKNYKNTIIEIFNSIEIKNAELNEEFAEIKRDIDIKDLNPDEYLRLEKELKNIEQQISSNQDLLKNRKKYQEQLINLSDKRNELLRNEFDKFNSYISLLNSSQNELLINIFFKGNKEKFYEEIRNQFRGSGIFEKKYKTMANDFSDFIQMIIDIFINDGEKLKNILEEKQIMYLKEKFENDSTSFINYEVLSKINIIYHDKPLETHSLGQRASALILLILSQKENNLIIIDQPEDDLDNQVIYKELITNVKRNKKNIQFIFATHNPNIPVLGDSEKIICTSFDNEKIIIEKGTIDTKEIQNKIINIMEGGKAAFDKRNTIYEFWSDKKTAQ